MYRLCQILLACHLLLCAMSQDDDTQLMSPCRMLCLIMSKQDAARVSKDEGVLCDACRPGQLRAPVRFGKRSDFQLKVHSRTFDKPFSPLLNRFQFHFEY